MRWIGILLLVAVMASGISAADAPKTDAPDARLDKEVTIAVAHTKLEDVVKQLSEQSGVEIKAGTGARDWKVRERKVTIDAKDVRLGALIDEISKLLGFYVSKSGKEGEWTYTYWQDMKARLLESEMLSAEKEAQAQRSTAIRQGALDSASEALKLSPEEAMKKKTEDPWSAYLGGTKSGRGYAALLGYLANGFPTERDLMLRGQQVTIPLANLPPNVQQAIADANGGGFMAMMRSQAENGEDPFAGAEPFQIVMMPDLGFGTDREMGMMGFGGMLMVMGTTPELAGMSIPGMPGGGFPMGMFPVTGSDSVLGKAFGMMFMALEEGATQEEIDKLMGSPEQQQQFLADGMARESKTEKTPPTDAELTREVELDELPKTSELMSPRTDVTTNADKVVAAISKAVGKPVLVESFIGSMPLELYLKPGKQPLYKILIGLEKAAYTWTFGEGALRIRPEDWAIQRSYDIAESVIARYKGILEKNGAFGLDDLAMIVTELTDEQIDNTLIKDETIMMPLMSMETMLGDSREVLRFYGSTSVQQRSAMASEAGLPFPALNSQQWDRLSAMITSRLGGVYVVDGNVRLEEPGDNGPYYNFKVTVLVEGEQEPRTFEEMIAIWDKDTVAEMRKSAEEDRKAMEDTSKEKGTEKPIKESDTQNQEAPTTSDQ